MSDLRIIVIGASMGGINFFVQLLKQFSPDWPVAVFIVQHISSEHRSQLDRILGAGTQLAVKIAQDKEKILAGHVYITPTDQHLIVKEGYVRTTYGPTENGSRPSINTLFRSAAVAYRQQAIGILLTGLLSDGTRGIAAIHECGGVTIVQDPEEAPYPDMPQNAIKGAPIDYIAQVKEMGTLINVLLKKPLVPFDKVPTVLEKEVKVAETPAAVVSERSRSVLNHGEPAAEDKDLQNSLWSILQFMQERTNMLENMIEGERIRGRKTLAVNLTHKAEESKIHTENLRAHLLSLDDSL